MRQKILEQSIKETALYNAHVKLGAKLVPFGGYIMPISYRDGIQEEYFAVRNDAGIFDVSHMGEFFISGNDAQEFLQRLTINDVSKLQIGDAQYSAMCYPDGGVVDDLILFRKSDGYFIVVNASNIQKDFEWLNQYISDNVCLENVSQKYSLIALQGPKTREILSKFTDVNLKMPFYSYEDGIVCGCSVMVSRTGYTGELGFEIYGDKKIEDEFLRKRKYLHDILWKMGHKIPLSVFMETEYNEDLDLFLYEKIGYEKLSSIVQGIFLSAYAPTSLREYFATGFAEYYLDSNHEYLKKVSPQLYKKLILLNKPEKLDNSM